MDHKRAAFLTLGCKVNFYDTEAMAELFRARGYEIVDFGEFADVYIVNTCTVTNLGGKKSRQALRRAKRLNPNAIVAAAGCYAQTAPEEIEKIPEVNIIIGTDKRKNIVDAVEGYEKGRVLNLVGDIMKVRDFERLGIDGLKNRCRAYIKIQEGCNRFCTYCIIPYARGPVRSREPDDIIDEVRALAKNGFKEVVLTGIHVASYGLDFKTGIGLMDIIKAVSETDGIERIRFSSVEPTVITDSFLEELSGLSKVCRHFHLSLQSGSDRILRAMNRRYTSEEYFSACEKIYSLWPDCAITTDIIAGFPGETEADFEESLDLAKRCKISKIHAFPYSPKKGTPAAAMKGQTDPATKQDRVRRLLELSDKNRRAFFESLLGKGYDVLFERATGGGIYEGHTTNYCTVCVKSDKNIENMVLKTALKEIINEEKIKGELKQLIFQ